MIIDAFDSLLRASEEIVRVDILEKATKRCGPEKILLWPAAGKAIATGPSGPACGDSLSFS
jgi:hypothetical protein